MKQVRVKADIMGWFEGGSLKLGFDLGDMDISLNVKKMEVEPVYYDKEEYETNPYYRRIRFIAEDGHVFEVSCSGEEEERLELQSVERLSDREPQVVTEEKEDSWLAPKPKKKKR
jgi:hypothetical protein